jgi:rhodanese-related sulfurtransferase
MYKAITPEEAKAVVHGGGEVAFLDVREHGQYGEGHPLFAVSCPYSGLEHRVQRLVPATNTPVLLLDEGDNIAERAARRLSTLGYVNLHIVAGGAPGWAAAGFTLFKGVNVPSKLLGELAEHVWHPRTVTPTELSGWKADGREFNLFDTRPAPEYRKMSIPGARWLPNGELAHRFEAVAPDHATPIVLYCAGRTRGLIGAVGLRLAGVSHPVYVLENGTQGWALAGLSLDHNRTPTPLPGLDERAMDASRRRARILADTYQIPWINAEELAELAGDQSKTIYFFDIRSEDEYEAGHWPDAVHAPGVQLVQATDQWVAVRHGRLALFDDTGLRGTLAAFWLRQLGFEPFVVPDQGCVAELPGRIHRAPRRPSPQLLQITVLDAFNAVRRGEALLLDLRSSQDHRRERPAHARWAIRPRLEVALNGWRGPVYLFTADAHSAALAAIDLRELGVADVGLVTGGIEGWRQSGLPVLSSGEAFDADPIDYLQFVHDRHDGNLEAARRYLAWEQGLVAQLDANEWAEFDVVGPSIAISVGK